MGDYYKYKKILVILMIVSCGFSIIKNIFKTKVQATEAIEITPTFYDGTYTIQTDNNFDLLRTGQLDLQQQFINLLYNTYSSGNATTKENIRQYCIQLRTHMASAVSNTASSRFIFIYRNNDTSISGSSFGFQIVLGSQLNNIIYYDLNINNGYKLLNTPIYRITRNSTGRAFVMNNLNGTYTEVTSGTIDCPCAALGVYSPEWVDLFFYVRAINDYSTGEYNSILSSIEETNELNYTQNYYTKQAVQNTYNYLTSDNIDDVTSSGITSPETQEPDLSDAIDSVQSIFERYDEAAAKQFTLRLPNGYTNTFSVSPDILKNALVRVGGDDIIIIIQTLWYIGVYGLIIFAYLKIYGSLLGGNLDNIVGAFSPMTSVLHSSLEVTGAFNIGDSTSFISLSKKG